MTKLPVAHGLVTEHSDHLIGIPAADEVHSHLDGSETNNHDNKHKGD